MRGQATPIQHFCQRFFRSRLTEPFGSCSAGAPNDWRRPYGLPKFGQQQKCLGQAFLPTSNPSTNSGRLSHLMVSLGLGSDVLNQGLKTPGSFQTYLLFTMHTEQAQSQSRCANFYFFRRIMIKPISKAAHSNRFAIGGAYRDRTDDPLLAKQVLSQLS